MSGENPYGPLPLDIMMDQDQLGAQAEALQAQHDVPEDQQHQVHLEADMNDMMEDIGAVEAPEAAMDPPGAVEQRDQPHNPMLSQPHHRAGLLLRHASQSSLDESSQRQKGTETRRPPYRNGSHSGRALEGMNSMRLSGLLCDVTLVADSTEIPAQKIVLAASSPYFFAMFTGFTERDSSRVVLQGVDPEALHILVDYVYTSCVDVTEENVQSLLPAANLLQLTDVRDACCEFLQSQLHPTNCLGIRAFADLHGCMDLLANTKSYIERHFTEVLECDEFLGLQPDQVAELIASDTITVPCEEKVFEAVITWINFISEERAEFLPQLMEHVRLPLLSQEFLLNRVDSEPLLKTNDSCKDFIIEAMKFHLLKGDMKLSMSITSPRTKPRQPVGLPKVMLAIGGQAPKAIRSVECYDYKDDRWFHLSEMPGRRCRCGVAVVRGRVYAVGGFNGSLRVRTVDMYDPTSDTWSSIASMEARRSTLGVAVFNDMIFAVGGFDGSCGLNTAELLDMSITGNQEWRPIASMSTRRSSVGVGVLGGLIYAVGGYDGNSRQCLASVEVYNPEQDLWCPVSEMSARRSGAGVGVLHGLLYSVGGHDGPLVRKTVECYNPDTNKWSPVADMNYCRRNAGVITHNGVLYVIGGDDGTSNLASVEMYSPKSDTWTVLAANMTIGRSYTGRLSMIPGTNPLQYSAAYAQMLGLAGFTQQQNLAQATRGNPYAAQAAALTAAYGQQGLQGSSAKAITQAVNVKFKPLPFYDIHGELLKPTSLVTQGSNRFQEAQFQFLLTPEQATNIASNRDIRMGSKLDYLYQIQLRFCQLDTMAEQGDEFPPSICVQVNNKMCNLPNPIPTNKPNVEPKRPPRPVHLTPLCKLTPTLNNVVNIKWAADYGKNWVVGIWLVEKLSSEQLLDRLVRKGKRNSEYTRDLIMKKLTDDDDGIATTNLKVTVSCPLGKMRMTMPCRPTTCDHLQCFDASLFLMMNEKKPTWTCPVCDSPARYDDLMIDGYFEEVIKSPLLPDEENEIILNQDGSWNPVPVDEEAERKKKEKEEEERKEAAVVLDLSDDDDDYVPSVPKTEPEAVGCPSPPAPQATSSAEDEAAAAAIAPIECIDIE